MYLVYKETIFCSYLAGKRIRCRKVYFIEIIYLYLYIYIYRYRSWSYGFYLKV